MKRFALACALCSFALCATAQTYDLEDTSWMMQLEAGSECEVAPQLEFTDTKVTGDLGCNRFMGTYTLKGDQIKFDNGAVTKRLCHQELMKLEDKMLYAINNASRISMTKKTLTFYDKHGKKLLTLVPEVAGACK